MKINWKVRVQNPWFWISLLGVIFSPVLTMMGISEVDLSSWESVLEVLKTFISSPYLIGVALVSMLSFLGISADPTTKGLSDSEQAMAYTSPKK